MDRSGKLGVLGKLLHHWKEGGHKALVFTQTQQMLDIVEKMVAAQRYSYHRQVIKLEFFPSSTPAPFIHHNSF